MMKRGLLLLALAGCNDDVGKEFSRPGSTFMTGLVAPTGVAAAPATPGSRITVTWNDTNALETGYRVDVDASPAFVSPILGVFVTPADATSHTFTGFGATLYYFRVVAVTPTLESEASAVVSATTPDPPPSPFPVIAAPLSSSQIGISWTDGPRETSYRIERSLAGGAGWSFLATLPQNSGAHIDAGLAPDTSYCYRVIAVNADGESDPSVTACATTASVTMTIETLASAGDVGQHASIGLGPGGTEHVSHYDATNTDLLHTTGIPGGVYTTEVVDTGPTGTQEIGRSGTALVVDGAGFVHIAAEDYSDDTLRYVTNSGGSFAAVTLDAVAGGFTGGRPRMAYHAASDTIFIAYHRYPPPLTAFAVRLAMRTGAGGWTFDDIPLTVNSGRSFGLAVDAAGNPHLSLVQAGTAHLMHAVRSGGLWTLTQVADGGSTSATHTAIAIDGGGFPHVAWYDLFTQDLIHSTNAAGSWVSDPIHVSPAGQSAGTYPSMAIDAATGRIHVAYYDDANDDLRYARKDPGGAWVLKLIDAGGIVGSFTSIALGPAGVVHIAYYDETNGDLKRAHGAP